ncbi:MAG TPA: hypothetical protein VMV29_19745 [Ktedonobacterales bacterium]|nr:hypothetical protein [Ktedonobacterales bacterium]
MKSFGCCCPIVLLGMVGMVVGVAAVVSLFVATSGRTRSRADVSR